MQLQKMLDLCSSHGGEIDIHFNPTKSHLLKVGKSFKDCVVDLHIDSTATKWVDSLCYLGVHIISSKCLKFDTAVLIRKFYASANAILSHTRYVSELTRLCLFESFTLPILTYCCDSFFIP